MNDKEFEEWLEEYALAEDTTVEQLKEEYSIDDLYDFFMTDKEFREREGITKEHHKEYEIEELGYEEWLEAYAAQENMSVEELQEEYDLEDLDEMYESYREMVKRENIDSEHDDDYREGMEALESDDARRYSRDSYVAENGEVNGVDAKRASQSKTRDGSKFSREENESPALQYHDIDPEDDLFDLLDDEEISYREVREAMKNTDELNRQELERMEREGRILSEQEQQKLREMQEKAERHSIESSHRGRF